jgi:uncharacterized RDD family membrane protein YckC
MKIKRFLAYIIDFFIVYIIAVSIFSSPIFKNEYKNYNELNTEYLEYIRTNGSSEIDKDIELQYLYEINKESQPLLIITCGLLIVYFGIIAFFCKGQTIGKKIFKLKVESINGEKLNPNLFMIRTIILTNLIPRIASIVCISFLSKTNWLIAEEIISYVSSTMLFLIIGFMIFRDDERGFHDVICKTQVISTK